MRILSLKPELGAYQPHTMRINQLLHVALDLVASTNYSAIC